MSQPRRLTRRQVFHLSAGTLLAAGLWPGALRADGDAETGEFHFLVVNDVHYLDQRCGTWMERVIKQMKNMNIVYSSTSSNNNNKNYKKKDCIIKKERREYS